MELEKYDNNFAEEWKRYLKPTKLRSVRTAGVAVPSDPITVEATSFPIFAYPSSTVTVKILIQPFKRAFCTHFFFLRSYLSKVMLFMSGG